MNLPAATPLDSLLTASVYLNHSDAEGYFVTNARNERMDSFASHNKEVIVRAWRAEGYRVIEG